MENVLGKDWGTHVEGQQLKKDGDSFRLKLNAKPVYDEWKRKVCGRIEYTAVDIVTECVTF